MKKWYYVLFVLGLYLFNRAFQEFVLVNGIISGIIAGLILAFLCKLIFSVVSKTIIIMAVTVGIFVFLFSTGYLEMPAFLGDLLSIRNNFRSIFNSYF